jgi:hypothetical protein
MRRCANVELGDKSDGMVEGSTSRGGMDELK